MTKFLIRRTAAGDLRPVPRDRVHAGPGAPVPRRADPRPARARGRPRSRSPTTTSMYGFDQPFYMQYVKWVGQMLHGNLGFSAKLNQSVASLIAQDLPKTIILVLLGTVVSLLFGIPLGLYQAVKRYTRRRLRPDRGLVPRVRHPDVLRRPAAGRVVRRRHPPVPAVRPAGHDRSVDPVAAPRAGAAGARLRVRAVRAVEPVHALVGDGQPGAGLRAHRAGQGRQRAAGALGARVPNSLISIVTLLGLSLPTLVAGAIFIEVVFNYPGMGLAFYNAALNVDYQVLLGFTVHRHAGDDRREPAGRHRLRGARPEGEVQLMAIIPPGADPGAVIAACRAAAELGGLGRRPASRAACFAAAGRCSPRTGSRWPASASSSSSCCSASSAR